MDDVSTINATGTEVVFIYGPFSAQSEFVTYRVARTDHRSPFFHGAYAYVSFFLTGENRAYKASDAAFGRVRPEKNFMTPGMSGFDDWFSTEFAVATWDPYDPANTHRHNAPWSRLPREHCDNRSIQHGNWPEGDFPQLHVHPMYPLRGE